MSTTDSPLYTEVIDENGMVHCDGCLGTFTYDPKEFEIQKINVPNTIQDETLSHDGEMYVLRYIGSETDGAKIHVPEGITSMDLMFANTNLKSAPEIPMGVTSMFATFASCPNLESANVTIPPTVEFAEFMFTDCKNLRTGPSVVPGNVKNANYMFSACDSLQNTPKIGNGVQQGEFMFAGCKALKKEPNVPRSMLEYKNMTMSCDGIDAEKDRKAQLKLDKDRNKYVNKLNRKGLLSYIGSGFGFAMQVHTMRQAGYGILMAPVMVHKMRKNGQLSSTFTGSLASTMMTKGGISSVLGNKLAQSSYNKEVRKQENNKQRLQNWDNAHKSGQGTWLDLKAQTRANKDLKRGLFHRITTASAQEKNMYRQMYHQNYDLRENMMRKLDSVNMLDSKSKQAMSKWYQQQMSMCATYYAEGMRSIYADTSLNPVEKQKAVDGLNEVSRLQMEPLMESAERIHGMYNIFNDGDLRNIKFLLKDLPSEKNKSMDFTQRVSSSAQDMRLDMKNAAVRNMQRNMNAQMSRGQQAEQRFGNMGGNSEQNTDYQY